MIFFISPRSVVVVGKLLLGVFRDAPTECFINNHSENGLKRSDIYHWSKNKQNIPSSKTIISNFVQ